MRVIERECCRKSTRHFALSASGSVSWPMTWHHRSLLVDRRPAYAGRSPVSVASLSTASNSFFVTSCGRREPLRSNSIFWS
jgi:hypothetical protein